MILTILLFHAFLTAGTNKASLKLTQAPKKPTAADMKASHLLEEKKKKAAREAIVQAKRAEKKFKRENTKAIENPRAELQVEKGAELRQGGG